MSGFTPGPWVVISDDGVYEVDADAGMSGCQPICRMGNVFTAKAANARLIAAAPDLYEALCALRECIMETRGPDANNAVRAADAALAKARGTTT